MLPTGDKTFSLTHETIEFKKLKTAIEILDPGIIFFDNTDFTSSVNFYELFQTVPLFSGVGVFLVHRKRINLYIMFFQDIYPGIKLIEDAPWTSKERGRANC